MDKSKILIVDDERINIDILRNVLIKDYEVFAAPDGEKALKIMPKIMPDLILLDIMMPKMDGYETLKIIKNMSKFEDVPVIFLTARNEIESKEKGFALGASDYITKPFEIAEVLMRVRTHIELLHSKKEVKLLLSKTLSGSVQILLEVLSIINPTVFNISTEIRDIVKVIVKKMGLANKWKYELSAMLYYIGCFPIKDEILQKIIKNEEVPVESKKMFDKHPVLGAKIVSKIPRLDFVAEIIKNQGKEIGNIETKDEKIICAQVLEVARYFTINRLRGKSSDVIIKNLRENKRKFNANVVEILVTEVLHEDSTIVQNTGVLEIKELAPEELKEGMVLDQDIRSVSGDIIAKKGSKVSVLLIEHLKLMSDMNKITGKIKVS